MFCKNCGAEMGESSRFCPRCGHDRMGEMQQNREIVEDNRIRYQVKPEFNLPYQIILTLWRIIIYLFFICACTSIHKLWFEYPTTFLITMGVVIAYIAIRLILGKMQYNDLEYNFYATKIEYKDGFINKEEKELKYNFVREVTMHQNILERLCGIGTIRIFTSASSGGYGYSNKHNNMRGRNGIYIHCVRDVQSQYQLIKQIIDEGTPED